MAVRIINRGRGPEVEGTRVTVYRIMDFVREDSSADRIATELHLTAEQVRVALDYIALHRSDVEADNDVGGAITALRRVLESEEWGEFGARSSSDRSGHRDVSR